MTEETRPKQLYRYAWGMNFCASFNPVYLCALAALMLFRDAPLFERQALNVLVVSALYTLPWLCSSAASHYFLNRYSARNVLFYTRVVEIIVTFGAALVINYTPRIGFIPFAAIVLLLGLLLSVYRPALKVFTASSVSRPQLAGFCAAVESATFLGILSATFLAVFALYFKAQPALLGLLPVVLALISTACCSGLFPTPEPRPLDDPSQSSLTLPPQLHYQQRYRELIITGVGECYVFAAIILISCMAIQYLDLQFAEDSRTLMHQYLIMGSPVTGAALGAWYGAFRSRHQVEIGLVPGGTALMILSALGIGVLPCFADYYVESGLLAILLFLFGFACGKIIIPLQSYQAFFIKKELAAPFFSWFYLPFSGGIMLALVLAFLMYYYEVKIFAVTLVLAVLTLTLSVASFALMPQFLLRMLMRLLSRTLYRIRIFHAERLPESGGALLVANRSSFVDMLFISACTSRPVRFMMHEHYYRVPVLHGLYRAVGFLEVPTRRPKQLQQLLERTRQLLRNGELICVFPEDDITRNGAMSSFRDGVANLLPPELDIPVIPMRIGMTWGSIFSCYAGGFKLRWPGWKRHPAAVTIGNPVPRDINAYQMRIVMSELAAETELVPDKSEFPLHSTFIDHAKRRPFRRTVSECSGPDKWRSLTDFQLMLKAILLSRYLRRIAADDGDYIGILLPNCLEFAISFLGIQMADKAPAMLNYTASRDAMEQAIAKAGIKHILTTASFVEKNRLAVRPEMVFLDRLGADAYPLVRRIRWFLASLLLPVNELRRQLSPRNWRDVHQVGALIFSSGSTGIPKGVMLTHHNIIADLLAFTNALGWGKSDKVLGNLPYFHSFGLTVCLWLPLFTSSEVVMIPNALDATAAAEALRRGKLTLLCATPGFLQLYMRRCTPEDFKSLRIVISGAEKLREDIAEKFTRLTGLVISEGYGCTELSPVVSINLAATVSDLGTNVVEKGSIGPPLFGVCAKIVDPSTFELQPENTDGLLIVKGAIVMKGYLNDAEKTKEVIRDNWYITGDIARMNRNGFITITGRLSRFSKIGGEMVPHELVEREIGALIRPDDRIFAVCGGTDPVRGEKLVVFYTDREHIAPEQLVKSLRERGIPNLWIPKPDCFFCIDQLPTLGSGKLDLAALQRLADEYCRR